MSSENKRHKTIGNFAKYEDCTQKINEPRKL